MFRWGQDALSGALCRLCPRGTLLSHAKVLQSAASQRRGSPPPHPPAPPNAARCVRNPSCIFTERCTFCLQTLRRSLPLGFGLNRGPFSPPTRGSLRGGTQGPAAPPPPRTAAAPLRLSSSCADEGRSSLASPGRGRAA